MTTVQAIRAATINASEALARKNVGIIEKDRWADIIAVKGDPTVDVTLLQKVDSVMKAGEVVKNK